MSASKQIIRQEEIEFYERLSEVAWPEDACFVIDRDLPIELLEALPAGASIRVRAGEGLKSLVRMDELAEKVLSLRATRPLTLIAVGGGSVGDAVGFLASVLWRGVNLWHVPTTLLAMVDSAHGGKTAVNLSGAKNQLGTFYTADRVVIVKQVLEALPGAQRIQGLTELIKGFWLGDEEGLERLDQIGSDRVASAPFADIGDELLALLERAIEVKRRVVREDPFETLGVRTILNLGHTAAHALELEMGASHGLAVAWGMAAAAHLSLELQEGFEARDYDRLMAHLDPLLEPLSFSPEELGEARFVELIGRDKKRIDNQLRSVLLDGPARPVVVTHVTASMWYEALCQVYARHVESVYQVDWSTPRARHEVTLPVSKSEYNRALLIAALSKMGGLYPLAPAISSQRPGEAEDILYLERALNRLTAAASKERCEVYAGLGGTTFRFLMVAAMLHDAPVTIRAARRLLQRPHDGLIVALESLGARCAYSEDALTVVPPPILPEVFRVRVDVSKSSQFASALAMLAMSGRVVALDLVTDIETGHYERADMVSWYYLQMTLDMLQLCGVESEVELQLGHIVLTPPTKLANSTLEVAPDESAAAFWRVANFLGASFELGELPEVSMQADRMIVSILEDLDRVRDREEILEVDLHDAPDLAPVLCAAAVHVKAGLKIVNAAHLRAKESNRIEDLVGAFARVGIEVQALEDGLLVPVGVQQVSEDAGVWPTHHDHRLAMAGMLCALAMPLAIERPWVVTKSYPTLIREVREAGATIRRAPEER